MLQPLIRPIIRYDVRLAGDGCCYPFEAVSGLECHADQTADDLINGDGPFLLRQLKRPPAPIVVLKNGLVPPASKLVTWCKSAFEDTASVKPAVKTVEITVCSNRRQLVPSWTLWRATPTQCDINECDVRQISHHSSLQTRRIGLTVTLAVMKIIVKEIWAKSPPLYN